MVCVSEVENDKGYERYRCLNATFPPLFNLLLTPLLLSIVTPKAAIDMAYEISLI